MKKKIIIIVVIFLCGVGIKKYYSHHNTETPDAVYVQVTHATNTSLPLETKAIGNLVGRSVEITSDLAGHVKNILFEDGANVTQGTLLIQLDDAVYQAQYESAAAQLAYSESNYGRMKILAKQGIISKQAIDQAESELKEKRAKAQECKVMVDKMKLLAPFDGIVGKRKVHVGDYVTVGQSVVTLTDIKHLHIEYNVPEKMLPLLKIGQTVSVKSPAYPGKTFSGKVAFISPTVNVTNRSISLYADVPNDNQLLAPGMLVEVTQSLGTENSIVMIPARSLVPVLNGEQVYTVVDGKAVAVPVTTGRRHSDSVQIMSGLSSGMVVITDGQLKIMMVQQLKLKHEEFVILSKKVVILRPAKAGRRITKMRL